MVDEAPERRKRGRPPKPKDELTRRPTVGLRVRPELYDRIVKAAEENGRSLSEEMEARIERAVSIDEDRLKFFHGNDGYMWAKLSADLYQSALMSTVVELGPDKSANLSEEFIALFSEKIRDGQDQIIKTWKTGMLFARLAQRMNQPSFAAPLKEALLNNKDLVEKLAKSLPRASEGKSGEGE